MTNFELGGINHDLTITIGTAFLLKDELEINLLNLFEGNNMEVFAQALVLNDELCIDILWFFAKEKAQSKQAVIKLLTRDTLTRFKEAMWDAVENFIDPQARPLLKTFRKQLPELLKEQAESLSLSDATQSENS